MSRLSHRDLWAALRFIEACDVRGGLHAFAASVAAAAPALISSDVTVFAFADLRAPAMHAIENPRLTTPADLQRYMRLAQQGPLPLMEHFGRTDDREARRLTDVASLRHFHRLPLYNEFYRPMRLGFVLGALVNESPTAFDGITLNRHRRDFTERDRVLLTFVRPHIVHGYRAAAAIDRLRVDLALAAQAIETPGFGLIMLHDGSRMQFVSPGAASLLTAYFGSRRQGGELPASLDAWVQQHTEAARDASRLPLVQTPFIVERNGGRLVVRLVQVARDTMLLLEDPGVREDWLRLAPLGMGARETRVLLESLRREVVMSGDAILPDVARRVLSLFRGHQQVPEEAPRLTPHEERLLRLLIAGHSYKTAAAALGSSVNTVAYHMKHIYDKLQVHSKAEAVARALRDRLVQ